MSNKKTVLLVNEKGATVHCDNSMVEGWKSRGFELLTKDSAAFNELSARYGTSDLHALETRITEACRPRESNAGLADRVFTTISKHELTAAIAVCIASSPELQEMIKGFVTDRKSKSKRKHVDIPVVKAST